MVSSIVGGKGGGRKERAGACPPGQGGGANIFLPPEQNPAGLPLGLGHGRARRHIDSKQWGTRFLFSGRIPRERGQKGSNLGGPGEPLPNPGAQPGGGSDGASGP